MRHVYIHAWFNPANAGMPAALCLPRNLYLLLFWRLPRNLYLLLLYYLPRSTISNFCKICPIIWSQIIDYQVAQTVNVYR